MRKFLILVVIVIVNVCSYAQQSKTITCENHVSQVFKGIFMDTQGLREISGGSKIIVNYDSSVPTEMQGAFEYAVKLWEEVLPLTLPIKIDVNVAAIRGASDLISKVEFSTDYYYGEYVNMYVSPLSMVKSVLLQEYHGVEQYCFYDEIEDVSILDGTDMRITYNQKMLDLMSFSLDGEEGLAKYDFVTLALRDIACGLGFGTDITANSATKTMNITGDLYSPFEKLIMDAIGTTNPTQAFTNATKGSLKLPIANWGGVHVDELTLYAPKTWNQNKSLRYFIPDGRNAISALLTYDFGTGYVMRDLSGCNWEDIFCGALNWRRLMTTGSPSGSINQTGSSENILPYKGSVTFDYNLNNIEVTSKGSNILNKNNETSPYMESTPVNSNDISEIENTYDYCKRYNLYSPNGPSVGVSLSVQKKDGTWDCIYEENYEVVPVFTIDMESLKLHYADSEYARGTTGGLKYRLTKCMGNSRPSYYSYKVKYFTRDFTPQKANIKYSKIHEGSQKSSTIRSSLPYRASDEYFIDVEIGVSNLEGTTRMVVEQLDEGEILPFTYEVSDFRKGYFVANLDRELSTQLTVISYNANGYKRSNTIVIPPQGYPDSRISERNINFSKSDNFIQFDGISDRLIEMGKIRYVIQNVNGFGRTIETKRVDDKRINISDLKSGLYVLTLYLGANKIEEFKFAK